MFVALVASPFANLFVFLAIDRALAANLSKAARNGRRKLSANLLDSVSVALFGTAAIGGYLQADFFAPIHIATSMDVSRSVAIYLALGFGMTLHVVAHTLVAGLED